MARNHPMKVAIQGEAGAFSHEAALQLLGERISVLSCQRFEEVFRALADGTADAAVVPIENTLHGSVHENYDHLLNFDFRIVAELNLRIVHNLIACPGVRLKDVRRVFSHPVALNQCLRFLGAHPEWERVPFYDTAGSVKMLLEERLGDAAAIASAVSAEIYGGRILKRSIEDDRQNYTRFFLLRRPDQAPLKLQEEGRRGWKTSIVFSTRNQPGSLFRALSAFALRDLSLTKIESRPLRGKPWEYLFYVDFQGHAEDEKVQKALGHLGELCDLLRVFGSYRA
ncbi:MAG: prephenate dehydratase [Bryobacteraceae bacterium]|nr:MAG: prephenate dehydratase [Bryobacteraceae bacterium]